MHISEVGELFVKLLHAKNAKTAEKRDAFIQSALSLIWDSTEFSMEDRIHLADLGHQFEMEQ